MKQLVLNSLLCVLIVLFNSSCSTTNSETDHSESFRSMTFKFQNSAEKNNDQTLPPIFTSEDFSLYFFSKPNGKPSELIYLPKKGDVNVKYKNGIYRVETKVPTTLTGDVNLVALLNGDPQVRLGMSYEVFEDKLIFRSLGLPLEEKLPMWGMVDFNLDSPNPNIQTHLLRSYARVNVKLTDQRSNAKFKMNNITSVRIYLSKSYGSDCPFEENFDPISYQATAPSIPEITSLDGEYNTSNGVATNVVDEAIAAPLLYDYNLDPTDLVDDEIFIPESKQTEFGQIESVVCAVIGVELEGQSGEERFYRVDFADYDSESLKPKAFKDIIRNKSYNFNLSGASTDGEDTPEEAYKTYSKVYVEVKVWDNYEMDSDLGGDYYFRISKGTDLHFSGVEGSLNRIHYSTNLSRKELKNNMKVYFKGDGVASNGESRYFELVDIDYVSKDFLIKTKRRNINNGSDNNDALVVEVYNQKFSIGIKQRTW